MATAGQGRIDQAKAKELAAKYAMEGQKDIEDAQLKLAQIAHLNAQAARGGSKRRRIGRWRRNPGSHRGLEAGHR